MHMRHAGFPGQPESADGRLVLRKDIAHTRCTPSNSLRSGLLAYFASNTDRPQQRQAINGQWSRPSSSASWTLCVKQH